MVIYLHIEQRLDTVAVMKVLGGRWSQILVVYLLEIGVCRWQAVPLVRFWRFPGADFSFAFERPVALSRGDRVALVASGRSGGPGYARLPDGHRDAVGCRARRAAPAVAPPACSAAGGTLANWAAVTARAGRAGRMDGPLVEGRRRVPVWQGRRRADSAGCG